MTATAKSPLHHRIRIFSEWIAPDPATEEAMLKQAGDLMQRISAKAKADGLTVANALYSGSHAKRTGIRRHLQHSAEVEGQDIDVGFILEPLDKNGKPLGCMIPKFKQYLDEIFPGSETGKTKHSATIRFRSNKKLRYDIIPLIKVDASGLHQRIIRTDGHERHCSVQQHIRFMKTRNAKAQGAVPFHQMVRLMKWWRYHWQTQSQVFGNGKEDHKVPTFLLDLLCAHAFDKVGLADKYPQAIRNWLAHLCQVVQRRQAITFDDFQSPPIKDEVPLWRVIDPVDPTNNVVAHWHHTWINELARWLEHSLALMDQAIQYETAGYQEACLQAMTALLGRAFRKNSETK
jgi:hypothetical protein